jgi:hypothetical protein
MSTDLGALDGLGGVIPVHRAYGLDRVVPAMIRQFSRSSARLTRALPVNAAQPVGRAEAGGRQTQG